MLPITSGKILRTRYIGKKRENKLIYVRFQVRPDTLNWIWLFSHARFWYLKRDCPDLTLLWRIQPTSGWISCGIAFQIGRSNLLKLFNIFLIVISNSNIIINKKVYDRTNFTV